MTSFDIFPEHSSGDLQLLENLGRVSRLERSSLPLPCLGPVQRRSILKKVSFGII
jgi:hypothetical protein